MGTVFQIPWTYFDEKTVWPSQGMAQLQNIGFKTVAMALRNDSVEIDDPELKRRKNWRSFSEQKVKGFWQRRWSV